MVLQLDNLSDDETYDRRVESSYQKLKQNKIGAYEDEMIKGYLEDNREISYDCDLSDLGKITLKGEKLLGRGSYGEVYVATDNNEKELAIKCCKIENKGIPHILEASIMSTIVHPHINRALKVEATPNMLYIIQERAETDLSRYTRRGGASDYNPTSAELWKWCFSLATAVDALHSNGIIHADIKASNVLLFKNGNVKLTDFTLSAKKSSNLDNFNRNVCTCTHRPLEALMSKPWNEKLDIWSLGCTFFEIAYGTLLFPNQEAVEIIAPDRKLKTAERKVLKENNRKRSINAIIDYCTRINKQEVGIFRNDLNYLAPSIPDEYNHPDKHLFNNLITYMLKANPEKRPSIKDVLAHPYFRNTQPPNYLIITRPYEKLPYDNQARIKKIIETITSDSQIRRLAIDIYCKCRNLTPTPENIRAYTCSWIAAKILDKRALVPLPQHDVHKILSTEREICRNLAFRLHC